MGVRSSLGSPCCILEQDTFTSQKVLVIPRKICWLIDSKRPGKQFFSHVGIGATASWVLPVLFGE